MIDEDQDAVAPEPPPPPPLSAAPAWGCALVAGVAFAVAAGSSWLMIVPGGGSFEAGTGQAPAGAGTIKVAVVAAVSAGYALGVWRLLSGWRPRRPPLWAALTGLTLLAATAGAWAAALVAILLSP